jgi:hypothetical protein
MHEQINSDCWNTVPDRPAAHCLANRLNELLDHGWLCRLRHFERTSYGLGSAED